VDYEKLLPNRRKAVEAFVSVFVHLTAGYIVFDRLYRSVLSAHGVVPSKAKTRLTCTTACRQLHTPPIITMCVNINT